MIAEKGLIDKLKLFGLNSYEAKIWVALLSRGVSSAGELSDISKNAGGIKMILWRVVRFSDDGFEVIKDGFVTQMGALEYAKTQSGEVAVERYAK